MLSYWSTVMTSPVEVEPMRFPPNRYEKSFKMPLPTRKKNKGLSESLRNPIWNGFRAGVGGIL